MSAKTSLDHLRNRFGDQFQPEQTDTDVLSNDEHGYQWSKTQQFGLILRAGHGGVLKSPGGDSLACTILYGSIDAMKYDGSIRLRYQDMDGRYMLTIKGNGVLVRVFDYLSAGKLVSLSVTGTSVTGIEWEPL